MPEMGDRRYDASYDAIASAEDRSEHMRLMDDEEVVHALAAASRKMDAYLANVLAVELLRRRRRQRAMFGGAIVGLLAAIAMRTALFLLAQPPVRIIIASFAALLPAALLGYATYRVLLARAGAP